MERDIAGQNNFVRAEFEMRVNCDQCLEFVAKRGRTGNWRRLIVACTACLLVVMRPSFLLCPIARQLCRVIPTV
jgi:hypothetical protein